jgi:hypothetical protein
MGLHRSSPSIMRIKIYLILLLTICSNKKTMATALSTMLVDIATSSSSSLTKNVACMCLTSGKKGKKQGGAAET